MTDVKLSEAEQQAAVAALWAYRSETEHYLRSYTQPDLTHADCCDVARVRAVRRGLEQEALNQRLRDVDGALQALDPECAQ